MKLKYLLLCLIMVIPNITNAKEIYFKNDNNIVLTKKEYDYIVSRFDEDFPSIMTKNDYDNLIKDELINGKMQVITNNNDIMPIGTEHTTKSKSLKISKICFSSACSMSVTLDWLVSPNVRSYDVMGAYLMNTSLIGVPTTHVKTSEDSTSTTNYDSQSNGFGVSVKLFSGSSVKVYQYYDTKPTGTVYASYQHATSNVSLANSKKYTISRSGYGGVFLFNSSMIDIYDAMGGVSINL